MKENVNIRDIKYRAYTKKSNKKLQKSLTVYGLDSEADIEGNLIMVCTSEGDVWKPGDLPRAFFTRKYRGANFVAFFLRYDSGSLLQHLPIAQLKELQETGETFHNETKYTVLANKYLAMRRSNHTVTVWDIFGFYLMSLNAAARKFLDDQKKEQDVTLYTKEYIENNFYDIADYCIHDACLAKRLAERIICKFEEFGVYPQKLYSTAYVSWRYFRQKCDYMHVQRFYDKAPEVLQMALDAYNGGKFEVTRKGPGHFYEYDIVSAYPYEISNLVDITEAKLSHEKKYRKDATYSFYKCYIKIPKHLPSPVALKRGGTNIYPVGDFTKTITKNEYEWLVSHGADCIIIEAVHLFADKRKHPYREEIKRLMEYKDLFKAEGRKLDYHTIKIFLNSLYGKMVQLINDNGVLKAGSAWNPIYGAVITANTRISVTEYQRQFPSIVAVHTDSLISTEPLPIVTSSELGGYEHQLEGDGFIMGCGVYQIGEKNKIRGFRTRHNLESFIPESGRTHKIIETKPLSWRQVAFRNLDPDQINHFVEVEKEITPAFDNKRFWLNDYTDFAEVRYRNVESVPLGVHDGVLIWP